MSLLNLNENELITVSVTQMHVALVVVMFYFLEDVLLIWISEVDWLYFLTGQYFLYKYKQRIRDPTRQRSHVNLWFKFLVVLHVVVS